MPDLTHLFKGLPAEALEVIHARAVDAYGLLVDSPSPREQRAAEVYAEIIHAAAHRGR